MFKTAEKHYGYFNKDNLNVVIEPEYESGDIFIDGYGLVFSGTEGSRVQVFDSFGNITFNYKRSGVFNYYYNDGLIYYDKNTDGETSSGFFDTYGNKIIKGNVVPPFSNGICKLKKHNRYYLIDYKGDFLTNSYGKKIEADWFGLMSNEIIPFGLLKNGSKKYGLLDINGNCILDTTYNYIGDKITGNYIQFGISEDPYNENISPTKGIIDTNGNIIIEPIYYEIMICKNGIFVVRYSESDSKTPYGSNNWKFITKEGELLYKTSKNEYLINKVHNLEECNDECYVFGQLQNEYNKFKYGLIAANGKKILLPIYDWIEYAGEGFWILKENNSFYLFSKTTGLQNPKEFLKFQ